MPSKGVDYYAYLGSSSYSVEFQFPKDYGDSTKQITVDGNDDAEVMFHGNRQISETDIGVTDHYGRYQWIAEKNNSQIASRYAEIAPSTGDMGDSNMGNMLQTPSLVTSTYSISYGFYDAGPGWGSLTDQDQSYVYVTSNHSNWMNTVAQGTSLGDLPFSHIAWPGVHDAGMFDVTEINSLLNDVTYLSLLASTLSPLVGISVSDFLALSHSEWLHLLVNFAFTQKDNITTMLNLGIRYFDFRPGYCAPLYTGNLYHQHNFIPGYSYSSFLQDILRWLNANPTEIVVVSLNFQGFLSTSMQPTQSTLNTYLTNAQTATGTTGILTGNKDDLSRTYSDLCSSNTRLIFLNQIGASDDATKYDSYDSSVYQTTDVDNVIGALNGMSASNQSSYDYTVLQLQATAEATGGGIFSNIATLSDATSVILSTKAMFDHQTYTWLRQNVANNFTFDKTIVFLNDFGDNALADIAMDITRQRIQ